MTEQLSGVEKLAARMFYNVSVQSAFALEDPNIRFIAEFQHKDGIGQKGAASIDDVAHQVYQTEADGGRAALEVKPPNSPALSRVLMWGGDPEKVIAAVIAGCEAAETFSVEELPALSPAAGREAVPGLHNRLIRLSIDPGLNAAHDVAALFAWGASSDKDGATLELMAWPINRNADFGS